MANRRRKYLIDTPFQLKYVMLIFALLLLQSLLILAAIFLPQAVAMTSGATPELRFTAAQNFLLLHKIVWPEIILPMVLLSGVSIFVTHKIIGPVYRLKKSLKEINGGNLGLKVTLRKNDEFHDLAEALNMLTEDMRSFFAAVRESHAIQSIQLAELERRTEPGASDAVGGDELVKRCRDHRQQLEELLKRFHT